MVEQWDTEEFAALAAGERRCRPASNIDAASHVPPVLTKTWFHTGVYLRGERVSRTSRGHYGADRRVLPRAGPDRRAGARTAAGRHGPARRADREEEREACRALKGSMLRQEVYALDGTDRQRASLHRHRAELHDPVLQPQGGNRHAVFFTHPREALSYHYERESGGSARSAITLTLEVDDFGNVLQLRHDRLRHGANSDRRARARPATADADCSLTYTENELHQRGRRSATTTARRCRRRRGPTS